MKTIDEITSTFEDLLAELNKDPEFRKEYRRQKLGYDYLIGLIESKKGYLLLEQAIYVQFYNIEQVQSIYVQRLREVYNVFVFLEQNHYDDELMDRLLDREGEILDLYQDNLFHFHYLPLLGDTQLLDDEIVVNMPPKRRYSINLKVANNEN